MSEDDSDCCAGRLDEGRDTIRRLVLLPRQEVVEAGLERCRWRWRDWGVFCRQSTGLADELDVGGRGREEPRVIPKLWFEKLADGGTICKPKRKGGLWEGEK